MYLDLDVALTVDNARPLEEANVVFTCSPTTTEDALTYQWYVDDVIIDSETQASYTLPGGDRGNTDKKYTCKVTATVSSMETTSPEKSVTFICK